MNKGRLVSLPLVSLPVVLLVVAGVGFFLGSHFVADRTPASPTVPSNTYQGVMSCSNRALALRISYTAPWECDSKEINENNGSVDLSSPLFKVELGNIGRASYCGSHPNDNKCVAFPFYSNDLIELSLQKYDGVNKEIFGVIKPDYSGRSTWTWIRATYKGMEERDLSAEEKRDLTNLLFSIKITK